MNDQQPLNMATLQPCSCSGPGYCPRMKRRMVGDLYTLCQTNDAYRLAFELDAVGRPEPDATPQPQPVEPNFFGKAVNYLNDRAEWISFGKPMVTDEVYEHRRAICNGCPDRNVESDVCKWCGCPLHATKLGDRLRWGVPPCPAKDRYGQPAPRWLAVLS